MRDFELLLFFLFRCLGFDGITVPCQIKIRVLRVNQQVEQFWQGAVSRSARTSVAKTYQAEDHRALCVITAPQPPRAWEIRTIRQIPFPSNQDESYAEHPTHQCLQSMEETACQQDVCACVSVCIPRWIVNTASYLYFQSPFLALSTTRSQASLSLRNISSGIRLSTMTKPFSLMAWSMGTLLMSVSIVKDCLRKRCKCWRSWIFAGSFKL